MGIDIFAKINSPNLSTFYKARYLYDLTKKINLPSKGTTSKVIAGELDKKVCPLLLKLAFYSRSFPMIGVVPILPPVEVPILMVKPPNIITFEETSVVILPEIYNLTWLDLAMTIMSGIQTSNSGSILDTYIDDVIVLVEYSQQCSKLLLKRLYGFLCTRIPLQRYDLLPRRYWVWDSSREKLSKICGLMILSSHIVEKSDLEYINDDDSILNNRHTFIGVVYLEDNNNMGGSCVVLDNKRKIY